MTSAPTPEDFERAREDGARISDVDPKRWLEWPVWRIQNLSNCLADALVRLEAAERKVEELTAELNREPCERCQLDRDGHGYDGNLPKHTCP